MSKAAISRLFGAAVVAVVAGVVIAIVAAVTAFAGGAIAIGGPQVVSVDGQAFAGTIGTLVVASLVIGAGAVAAIVSWIGALFNTSRLEDKTWFLALLGLGLVSLGWVAMIAYAIAGPDGAPREVDSQGPAGAVAH